MKDISMNRPVVGDSVLSYVGSGRASKPDNRMVKVVPRGTEGRGSSPTGTSAIRGSSKISEACGPRCCIKATLYESNAAAAGEQTRNVKIMPSAAGVGDFWKSRSNATRGY